MQKGLEILILLLKEVLKLPPAYKPGKGYTYSNSSIAIAGLMLEKVSGHTWEDMLKEKLAKPLGINSIGYGIAIKDNSKIDWWRRN